MGDDRCTIIPGQRYHNAPAAIEWLCTVIGFERRSVHKDENGGIAHAELTLGNGIIMLSSGRDDSFSRRFKTPDELHETETRIAYIAVPDADAVHERALNAGARITRPIQDNAHGFRDFAVKDTEGHTWIVGTYNPWDDN